ncbi:MAG: pectate lyase precursor [Gammaproteobacteria bacterium]|nr:MAG: pectate lyase precursor [Gammaproteobacteria bacterium]
MQTLIIKKNAIATLIGLSAFIAAESHAATNRPSGYTTICTIGESCSVSQATNVAFGASGAFVYKVLNGNFTCSVATFGSDPIPSKSAKECSIPTTGAGISSSSVKSSSSISSIKSSSSSVKSSSSSAKSSSSVALFSSSVKTSSSIKSSSSVAVSSSSKSSSSVASVASSSVVSSSSSSAATNTTDRGIISTTACTGVALAYPDAATLTGESTPLQTAIYGVRNYSAPAEVDGLHSPSNYRAAPVLPTWEFATSDPSHGVLTSLECDVAADNSWAVYARNNGSTTSNTRVTVTGGRNASASHIYTVFNGQQLVNAINDAGLSPKIIRIVGHIDLRYSNNNKTFKEYTSYSDQKYGGSIAIPSNTTLVGINGADNKPARITGTSILIGGELGNGALAAEEGFKAWIAAGKDGDKYPTWTRNVIIRNLKLDTPWDVNPEDSANAYADGVTLSRAQNIYIDRVSISDGDTPDSLASDTRHDGALDVVRGSDYVTIANSYFTKHHKTTLVGNGDSGRAWSDDGRLHVTFANNWWDSTGARLPLNRFGQVHMYNNLISGATETDNDDLKFESGVDARYQSNMLLENLAFNITGLKVESFCGKAIKGKSYKGYRSTLHKFTSDRSGTSDVDGQCGFTKPSAADTWTPPYSYSLQLSSSVENSTKATAGAGK